MTTLKKIKGKFERTMQWYSPQDLDGHQHWWDFIKEVYSLGIKKGKEEREKEIIGIFKWQFEQALEDGKTTPKEYGGGKDPRVRVKWFLDVFIPSLTHKQKYYGWQDCCPLCGTVRIGSSTCGLCGFKWKKGYVYFSDTSSIADWSDGKYIDIDKKK